MNDAPADEKTRFPQRHVARTLIRHQEERRAGKIPDYRESHEAILLAAAALVLDADPNGKDPRTDVVRAFLKERAEKAAMSGPPHWIKAEAEPADYEFQNGPDAQKSTSTKINR